MSNVLLILMLSREGMDGFKDLILIFEYESGKAKMANVACLGVFT